MLEITRCLGVLDLGDAYFVKRGMNLLSFQANTDRARELVRSYKMKAGDYLVLINKYETRVRLFAYSGGVGWLVIPEYDRQGSHDLLLRALTGLSKIVAKSKDVEVIQLKIEHTNEKEDRRKAVAKAKLKVA